MQRHFKDLDIFQQRVPLQKLHLMTLTYFVKVKIYEILISFETLRASETCEITLSTLCF